MRLVASALSQELRVAKKVFSHKKTFFRSTWIGNYNALLTLTWLIENNPDLKEIFFVGICGWSDINEPVIQGARVINAHTWKEIIVPVHKKLAPLHSIVSSEVPIHDVEWLKWEHFVDMESWWVALVAQKYQLPLTILRVPIDEVGTVWCETVNYQEALTKMEAVFHSLWTL